MTGLKLTFGDIIAMITALGVIVALIGNALSIAAKRDEKTASLVEMRADVKHIREKVDRQDLLLDRLDERIDDVDRRVVLIDAATRRAHDRLDEIQQRKGGM